MGIYASYMQSREPKKRSDEIDGQIMLDEKAFRRQCTIWVLGKSLFDTLLFLQPVVLFRVGRIWKVDHHNANESESWKEPYPDRATRISQAYI